MKKSQHHPIFLLFHCHADSFMGFVYIICKASQDATVTEMASVVGNHSQAITVICFLLSEASSVTN